MRGICATYVHTPPKLCAANTMTTPTQFSLLFIPSISFSNNASHRASGYFTPYSGLSVHHVLICNDIEQRATANRTHIWQSRRIGGKGRQMSTRALIVGGILAVDPWAPNIDSQSIASQLFAASLFPYLGFLYHITKSNSAPKLTLFGFYFLLAFVGATTKVHYGTSLSNVDWLHGSAESLLSLTNLFIVLGLRHALRREERRKINSDIDNEKSVEAKEQEETSV